MSKLTIGQTIALDNTLSIYPDGFSLDQILMGLSEGDDDIGVWEQLEHMDTNTLCDWIISLAKQIDSAIGDK